MKEYRVRRRNTSGTMEPAVRTVRARSSRAAALLCREPGEVLADSYDGEEGQEVYEVFSSRAELREYPDGDPYADTIEVVIGEDEGK